MLDVDSHVTFHPRNFFLTVAAPTIVANVSGRTHVAVDGYDPVSFFDNEPVNGNFQIKSSYEGATYFFKDEANKAKFEANPKEYLRDVASVLRQPAPAPGGDEERLTCAFETRYSALHFVSRNDPAQFGVRDLKLGDTVLCCVDHPSHDGSKVCDREF